MSLDPTIKFNLQTHLINAYHSTKKSVSHVVLGTTEQLKNVVKITSSEAIERCFKYGTPQEYPRLPKRNYLVACVDRWLDVKVYTIYTFEQMRQMEAQRNSPQVNRLEWNVLEIPEELEKELLKEISLESGLILSKNFTPIHQDKQAQPTTEKPASIPAAAAASPVAAKNNIVHYFNINSSEQMRLNVPYIHPEELMKPAELMRLREALGIELPGLETSLSEPAAAAAAASPVAETEEDLYLCNIKELKKAAAADLGQMDEADYKVFYDRMKEVAAKNNIAKPKLVLDVKFKPGAHDFLKEQPVVVTAEDWEIYKADAKTMCEYMPHVFVVDCNKYSIPL